MLFRTVIMNISKIINCYGCMACVDKCPKQCISVKDGKLGHLYPQVTDACINCGLCLKVCPAENEISFKSALQTWAAWRRNEKLRVESSSGGIASAISELFIANGGVVYGCAFVTPGFSFRHVRCINMEDLRCLKGSKYVQSNMQGVYKQIADDLKNNRKVLFIGTPCQVAGVKTFFCGKEDNLYTVDLICHGVPSVRMLKDSLSTVVIDKDFNKVEFRVSTKYHFSLKCNDEVIYERPLNKDWFLKGFFTALFYRDSCYTCKFAKTQRISDITLGDFWGIDKNVIRDKDEEKGISLCIINTTKGNELFNQIIDIEKIERPIEEAIVGNKQLQHPMKRRLRAQMFKKLYPIWGFKWSIFCVIPEIVVKNKIWGILHKSRCIC